LGCHRKQSPTRISRRLPGVALPALAGVAAAFCLAPQALADPSPAQGSTHQAVLAGAASQLSPSSAQLLSVIDQTEQASQASQHQAGSAQPASYTVKAGDSLSSIAGRAYHDQKAWPVLYWANRSKVHWANVIEPGQVLRIPVKPARIPNAPGQLGPAPAPTQAPTSSAAPVYAQSSTAGVSTGGSFQQCVIARESGGNAQVMNATGHYGLYQFSASTWAAYGGNPADFGNASVSEQNAVFNNAIAQGGQSNWSAYDGC
jgi:LysM repeat protein